MQQALTVSSSGLDGIAASRETIDTNVPEATIRISDGNGRISTEGRVQVVPDTSCKQLLGVRHE